MRTRYWGWSAADGPGRRSPVWVRTQCAGSSPGVRTRFDVMLGVGGAGPSPVSARSRSALVGPARIQTRSMPAAPRTRSAISPAASAVDAAVASDRLRANRVLASSAPRAASSARACWVATSLPIASATNRNRTRSSTSRGSATASERRGFVNRKSYVRNAAIAVATAGAVPATAPTATTATR